jgi:hypothetical protein
LIEPDVWGIDADIVAYRVAFIAEKEGETLEEALAGARASLQSIINVCGDEGILYLTDSASNFRIAEASEAFPYKGNRKDASRPPLLSDIKQWMIDEYDAELQIGQEADDALSIGACQHGHGIATIDKDLDGCPGWHYNWNKGGMYYVSSLEADRFFYTQMLTGDATDNIPGLSKRTGKNATAKVKAPLQELVDIEDMYEHVLNVYLNAVEDKGMSSDRDDVDRWLLQQGRCLWMRREEGQMWTPPSLRTES